MKPTMVDGLLISKHDAQPVSLGVEADVPRVVEGRDQSMAMGLDMERELCRAISS
jgi:hypothetical protein